MKGKGDKKCGSAGNGTNCKMRTEGCIHRPHVNTCYLYSVSSRLVNVRLDEERQRKARILREQGVSLSDVIREAIDERFERLNRSRTASEIREIVERVHEQYPDPVGLPLRAYDLGDRKAAREAIVEKLRRRVQ